MATRISLRVVPAPEAVRTLVAFFDDTGAAGEAVTEIVAAGIVPGAIEMMDRLSIQAAEQATGAGYRLDAGAALLVELDGPREECTAALRASDGAVRRGPARCDVRVALTEAERALIWRTRKAAFAAMGRIAPAYFVQDGVIPRTRLPEVLRADRRARRRVRPAGRQRLPRRRRQPAPARLLRLGARPGEAERAEELSGLIVKACVDAERLDHRRARRRRRQEGVHAVDVLRGRPRGVPPPALRVRPAPGWPTPAR